MHVVITGGSSGIGLAVARLYVERGVRVTLIGRGLERLEAARELIASETGRPGDDIGILSVDVSDDAAVQTAIASAEAVAGPCDILVTSAGVVKPAPFERLTGTEFRRHVDTNLHGTVHAISAVYAGMKARRQGKIMIVSSGAGLIGLHGYTAYCASKSALVGFAEALRVESRSHGIAISICFPPDTDTPQLAEELKLRPPEAVRMMGSAGLWSAEAVARRIVRGLDRGHSEIFFTPSLYLLARLGGIAKPWIYRWFHHSTRRR
ncbi:MULTISPECIES: SDR family oxidoreductase [Alphaproteobacteria]|uniref:3-dehydrosphinganine reductase n=2 Tax=Alphaproteobacteria TaxID=28211 RepID=A0A512HJR7_9HYPH|nr:MULTISPECIES: SDR family oxidoreductase [Alphaproteobacteria]GEO85696.1 ribitol type dehydrogenase [Ciceribacter naphthalenivorans]GLR21945.1 ribitol type dehydrogenase [Ciceribacter naphthalenivorans]GLT04801.1 ribitol type dehydrogenase [Sphingomonas psychrolutea]